MASRLKKILHRKSQNFHQEHSQSDSGPVEGLGRATIGATPYDATAPGGLPETGAYPIKGDGSSTSVQKNAPSDYGRGQQGTRNSLPYLPSTSNQPSALANHQNTTVDPRIDLSYNDPYDSGRSNAIPVRDHVGGRNIPSETLPLQDFSRLNLGDGDGDARATRTPPQRSFAESSNFDETSPNRYGITQNRRGGSPIRIVGEESPQEYNATNAGDSIPNHDTRQRLSNEYHNDGDLRRPTSIPRKQVGSSSKPLYSDSTSFTEPYGTAGHDSRMSIEKQLPSTPVSNYGSQQSERKEDLVKPSGVLDRSRHIPRSIGGGAYTAQDVVQRAQHNSSDTKVIERIAPAVVHENVQKQVHHVREEVITREIHDHDVYHRILPVIDVEVLPPRHFLPVEGGGLVEISASEVPGRGKNWVIAETASKIPSDQPAPTVPARFSAREFHGTEGDARSYKTPEGYERSEQTWVHPPELEMGGRDSGQTWPMAFGDTIQGKHHRGQSSERSYKSKGHRKSSSKHSASVSGADQPSRAS